MKYLVFLLLVSTFSYSQEAEDIINTKKFVLEANKVTDEKGKAYPAVRRQCFIMIDSTSIIIQWISEFDNNGLGGITIAGNINGFKHDIHKNDKETQHILNITCDTDQGRVKSNLVLEIYNKSHAEAFLKNSSSSIFIPEEMRFLGKLIPLQSSKIVIGAH